MNQLLGLAAGAAIGCGGRRYVITHILSLEAILAKDQETGRSVELKLCDITPPPTQLSVPEKIAAKDLALIEQKDWTIAELWFSRIYPLLSGRRTDEMVRAVAQEAGVHRTTVYRKLARYEQSSRVSELTPTKPTGGKGQSRLAPEAEAIVDSLLKEVYLNKQKRSFKKTADEISRSFAQAELKPPHYNTIRKRILAISEKDRDKERLGAKAASKKHDAFPGHFPGADWPRAVVLDEVHYYSDVLRRFVNAKEPHQPRTKRKFTFRRDPRDISTLYFYDPEVKDYFRIPYRDTAHSPMSIWEFREARRRLEKEGVKEINEALIFRSYEQMRVIEDQARHETKHVRRKNQQRRDQKQIYQPKVAVEKVPSETDQSVSGGTPPVVQPFDELEEL